MMNRWLTTTFFVAWLMFLCAPYNFAQRTLTIKKEIKPEAKLVDEFGKSNSEMRSARFDTFFAELNERPNSIGYVFLFCGNVCQYGEIESHFRGIEVKINLRRFDRTRLVVLNGGYRESFGTEIWLVPEGASPPTPKSTINIKDVTFKGMRKWMIEPYDCCDNPTQMWKDYKKN